MVAWLRTARSTGLGRAVATAELDRGDNTIVTARDVARVEDLAARHPDAVATFRAALEAQLASLEEWRAVGENTDIDA